MEEVLAKLDKAMWWFLGGQPDIAWYETKTAIDLMISSGLAFIESDALVFTDPIIRDALLMLDPLMRETLTLT